MTEQRVEIGEVVLRAELHGCQWHITATVGHEPEPGTAVETWTGSDLDEGITGTYGRMAERLGLPPWNGDIPGRDDLLIELRETLAGLNTMIDFMKHTHEMRLRHLPQDSYHSTIYEAQAADGRPMIADAIVAKANVLVAIEAAERRRDEARKDGMYWR